MYLGASLLGEMIRPGCEKTYLVYTIDPKLLKGCMSSYSGHQGSHAGQDDSGPHVDSKVGVS